MVTMIAAACISASDPSHSPLYRGCAFRRMAPRLAAEGARAGGEIAGAAVNHNLFALNIGGVAGSEKEHGASDLFGFSPAFKGHDFRQQRIYRGDLLRSAGAFPERGARVAGGDDIDANAARAELGGHGFRHGAHGGFAAGE